jgi:AcrR family transcriptional regulator
VSAASRAIARPTTDPVTDRILDAAMAQFLDFGLRRTTVEDVAVRAGVSRVTVHRRFGRKDDLVRGVIMREVARFLDEFDRALAPLDTLERKLVEGFVVTMRAVRTHPLIQRVLKTEPESLLPELTIHGEPYLTTARGFLLAAARVGNERYLERDVAAVGEIFIRLVASFALTPSSVVPRDDRAARAFAHRYLAPLLATIRRRPA